MSDASALDRKALLEALLQSRAVSASAAGIPRRPDPSSAPLSFAQERLWILDRLDPGLPIYNVPFAARLRGSLDVSALSRALNVIVRRHETLRTVFPSQDGQPIQQIQPPFEVPLPLIEADSEAEMRMIASEEGRQSFDLAAGPLIRAKLVRLAVDDHVLLITMHHIVTDGLSRGVLVRELNQLYGALVGGRTSDLPEIPVQYGDYAAWQREKLSGERVDDELAYWRQKLEGAPAVLELPTDRPRPAVKTYRGDIRETHLPRDLSDGIKSLARSEGVTLFMTLLTAYAALVRRYSGQEDVVIGTPVANRPLPELEGLIGFFVNTLALRIDLSSDPTFRELLGRVRETVVEAFGHQEIPFEKLVSELQPERSLSHTPIFQTYFVYQGANRPEITFAGLTLEPVERDRGTARVDLQLSMIDMGDHLGAAAAYDTDLFDASTIDRMLGHFQNLLTGIVVNPDGRISRLPLLDVPERNKLLVEWNQPNEYPSDRLLHRWFEDQVERFPDRIAVTFPSVIPASPSVIPAQAGIQNLTYEQLNSKTNKLAHLLIEKGVKPDTLVGLCIERSLEMVIGILGILKAGGAYVPLDPAYPADRLAYMLADSRVPVVVTQQSLLEKLPGSGATEICLDTESLDAYPNLNPAAGIMSPSPQRGEGLGVRGEADNAAYIIYTSGSTGQPKGVVVTHRNVVRLFTATDHWYGFNESDVWTLFHSYAFDFSVWELWGALLYGGKLVVVPYMLSRSPEAFRQLLIDECITVLNQTPSAFRQLINIEVGEHGSASPVGTAESSPVFQRRGNPIDHRADQPSSTGSLSNLRYVIFGGEKLDLSTLRPWVDKHGDEQPKLVNMYGITETTVHVTYRLLTRQDIDEAKGSLIGERIPDLTLYVLDSNLQPCPIGVPGEICVGGAGLAREYLNQPDLTASKFVAAPADFLDSRLHGNDESPTHPLTPSPPHRLYRSGDLARFLPSGDLEYLGRVDDQVKIRGFRIELGEIEAVLQLHPAIRECVVLAREDVPGSKQLAAYLTVNAGANKPSTAELRSHAHDKLPDYMVPAAFMILDCLPLTQNGKVDRRSLPRPEAERTEEDYEAPQTPAEETLARIWSEILRIERVGVRDNFFELGGDSILAIRIITRANAAGLRLTPRDMFQYQIIAELAEAAGGAEVAVAEQGAVTGEVKMTPIQHWFFARELEEDHHYNQSLGLRPARQIDPAILERAIAALAEHHDALRLRFERTPDGWRQWNAEREENRFFAHLQTADVEAAGTELQSSLNLESGPIFRAALVDLPNSDQRIVLVLHHMTVDGVTWRILLEDLQSAYKQLETGQGVTLPPKTTSFKEWARRLGEFSVEGARDYWLSSERSRVRQTPVDHPDGANRESDAALVTESLSEEDTTALLQDVPPVYRTQINDVLLAAIARVFGGWTGDRECLIDLEGHGREDLFEGVDITRTAGWFTTIYPVLLRAESDSGETLKSVKELLRAVPGKGIGYGVLRYLSPDVEVRERLRALPQAEISFNYLGQFDESDSESGLFTVVRESMGPAHSPRQTRSHKLAFSGRVNRGQMQLAVSYSRAQYEESTVQRLVDGFADELRAIIEHCRQPDAGGVTPSDFKRAKLDQKTLDKLLSKIKSKER